jgi:hypothetical protein
MKVEKLVQFIKDELLELGFTKEGDSEYQYKDIYIMPLLTMDDETLVMQYCDSKCDSNDMSYDTCFTIDMKKKDIKERLQFIKDNQGELHNGNWCVWVNYPANV